MEKDDMSNLGFHEDDLKKGQTPVEPIPEVVPARSTQRSV